MTSRGLLPRYSELFTGRFCNKIEWVGTLRALGYQFYWLAPHFLVHRTHPTNPLYSFLWDTHVNAMMKALSATLAEVRGSAGLHLPASLAPPRDATPRRAEVAPRDTSLRRREALLGRAGAQRRGFEYAEWQRNATRRRQLPTTGPTLPARSYPEAWDEARAWGRRRLYRRMRDEFAGSQRREMGAGVAAGGGREQTGPE